MASFRNVKELMDVGIHIKSSLTRHRRDISFRSNTACLRIPPITIDSSTKAMFLNLIACKMRSDVKRDFISYLRFLDSLIGHADDVWELQSIGILQNNLDTHKEVAIFFNTVSTNLESNFNAYKDMRVQIRKHLKSHYNSRVKMWMRQCLDTYFGSPWTIIAWAGASFLTIPHCRSDLLLSLPSLMIPTSFISTINMHLKFIGNVHFKFPCFFLLFAFDLINFIIYHK